jgi:hypothetical protein
MRQAFSRDCIRHRPLVAGLELNNQQVGERRSPLIKAPPDSEVARTRSAGARHWPDQKNPTTAEVAAHDLAIVAGSRQVVGLAGASSKLRVWVQ